MGDFSTIASLPNPANIDSPIVLVGQGRSGTSLVSSLFSHHPDCTSVGETLNLIFGVWYAVRASASTILPLVDHGDQGDHGDDRGQVSDDDRAGRLVRHAFLATLPDDRTHWMQKPIGVPRAIGEIYGEARGSDEAAATFWRVLRTSFPGARYFTVLRHPCDVVLSGLAHWGKDQRTLWRSLADLARYLVHPDAPPIHAVAYGRLVRDREASVVELCEAIRLPYDPRMLAAFDRVHVAAPGRSDPALTDFSRRHEWESLNGAFVTADERAAIAAMFARFGHDLEWPAAFNDGGAAPEGPISDAERAERLEAVLKDAKISFERARLDHADQLRAREAEFARVWAEQRDWIAELERAKAWLDGQMQHWRAEAERLQRER